MTQEELILKVKGVKSAEELFALAKENGMELTAQSANAYFEQLNKSGELSDGELDNVAGGGCYEIGGDRLVVTTINSCGHWRCEDCGGKNQSKGYPETPYHRCKEGGPITHSNLTCGCCKYCSYEKGIWYCNHDANQK
jgi:hypothetical protein